MSNQTLTFSKNLSRINNRFGGNTFYVAYRVYDSNGDHVYNVRRNIVTRWCQIYRLENLDGSDVAGFGESFRTFARLRKALIGE